jgi:hypothetical protein
VACNGGEQFRRRGPIKPCGTLCARRGIHGRGQGAMGQLGDRRRDRRPHQRPLRAGRPYSADQSHRHLLSGDRAVEPAAMPAGPPSARAGRLFRYRPPLLRRGMPRRFSLRTWKKRRRRHSTPTSKVWSRPRDARPARC